MSDKDKEVQKQDSSVSMDSNSVTSEMATEISARKKARGGVKSWVTRQAPTLLKKVEDLQSVYSDSVKKALALDFKKFQERVQRYEELQEHFLSLLEGVELDQEVDEAISYEANVIAPVILACEEVLNLPAPSDSVVHSDTLNGTMGDSLSEGAEAKLPKLTLPNFDGDVKKWKEFNDLFKAMVHNKTNTPDITKFGYLKSVLSGEAKAAIEGLTLTASNYHTAWELLEERFGRDEVITFAHIQELLLLRVPARPSVVELWAVYNSIKGHVRSLAALGITGDQYGVFLTPLILTKLPDDIRDEWSRGGDGKESDLTHLMNFLKQEIQRRERSKTYSNGGSSSAAAAALHAASGQVRHGNNSSGQGRHGSGGGQGRHGGGQGRHDGGGRRHKAQECAYCGKAHHTIETCYAFKNVPKRDRKDRLREKKICWRCLLPANQHTGRFMDCTASCKSCGGKHHELLCLPNNDTDSTQKKSTSNTSTSLLSLDHSNVLLQTLQVTVRGKQGRKQEITALFDTGSDRTYISQDVVDKIGAEWIEKVPLSYASFGSDRVSQTADRDVHAIHIQAPGGEAKLTLQATAIKSICANIEHPAVPTALLEQCKGKCKGISVPPGGKVKIDLLVGLDYYWHIMTSEFVQISDHLVAQNSTLGWVLSGRVPTETKTRPSIQLFCHQRQNFWDLETIGIEPQHSLDSGADSVQSQFDDNIAYTGTRYQVSLPWKEGGRDRMVDNKGLAMKRLDNLTTRLNKDEEMAQTYHDVIQEMWVEGIIEEVVDESHSGSPVYYLPHHPVVKEASVSTKVRPVFDASAKSYNKISLNDCMETGPNLLPDLVGVLVRFRRWKYALTADVRKAFLQVEVHPDDRDVHRFLWDDNGQVRTMRFKRVPFGNKGSPFLLMATIRHHLSRVPNTQVVQEIIDNLYMDDLLTGTDTEKKASVMFEEAQNIMKGAGMDLTKWGSNSDSISKLFGESGLKSDSLGVLGLKWDPHNDVFFFDGLNVSTDLCVTKRVVLSLISKLFDPLGLLTPFAIRAKCLFQDIWRQGLDWDEVLCSEMKEKFQDWLQDLAVLRSWSIPRRFFSTLWSEGPKLTLHGFGDASEKGYGACIYLVSETPNGVESSLVMSRARVAPLKTITLPRLELLGALLCSRLIVYVRDTLKLSQNVPLHCWTDSTIALAWIKGEPLKWNTFVRNRVKEIQRLVGPSSWQHCPGKDNPADLVTRGISAEELKNSKVWLHGPQNVFTSTETHTQTTTASTCTNTLLASTGEQADPVCADENSSQKPTIPIERYSTLIKAMRVTGYVLRFVNNLKSRTDKQTGKLTFQELVDAKHHLIKEAQTSCYSVEIKALKSGKQLPRNSNIKKLSPFIGEHDFLRVQGRLQFAGLTENSQHPIIVPRGHLSMLLAHHVHIKRKHSGVNSMLTELKNNYWIVGARRTCKTVKKRCVACQRQDARPCKQPNAPLPEDRVKQSSPFAVSGIDHAGPLYCADYPGEKFYILLFTCAVVRAVHLELVDSLSCEATLLALRRFFARRGMCACIWSDNAKGFVAAKDRLLTQMAAEGPDWKFIVPRAPWYGGWWERLVGTVKASLRKTLGKNKYSRVELETVLQEVEACINSRPLTYVGDDLDSGRPLTPSHFLLGRASFLSKGEIEIETECDLEKKLEARSKLMGEFWSTWQEDYLKNLPPYRGNASKAQVKVGSVVLVEGEGNRFDWPLGIIESTHPGKDGLVRAVDIRTAKGKITRPIQRLRDLEISASGPDSPTAENDTPLIQTPAVSTPTSQESTQTPHDSLDNKGKLLESAHGAQETLKTRHGRTVKKIIKLDL